MTSLLIDRQLHMRLMLYAKATRRSMSDTIAEAVMRLLGEPTPEETAYLARVLAHQDDHMAINAP